MLFYQLDLFFFFDLQFSMFLVEDQLDHEKLSFVK